MAKQLKLSAQTRTGTGRSAVNLIKKQGLVPAVIYGAQAPTVSLTVNAREITTLLAHATSEHVLVDLEISDNGQTSKRLALIQEVQHDPIKQSVLHIDFHAVKEDEIMHAEVPVQPVGEASGVKNFGGILELAMHALEIECLPKDLPEAIVIDVSALNVGEGVHVKDLQLPEGVTTTVDGDLTVVRVAAPAVEIEPTPAEAAAAPEVLKEKKDDAKPAAAGAKSAAGAKTGGDKK